MKEQNVSAIEHGTVIDHIPPEYTFKIVELLQLQNIQNTLVIATRLQSTKMQSKGLIKVAGMELNDTFLQKIALIAPHACVSIIRDYEIVHKKTPKLPNELKNILLCINPNCITNKEECATVFFVEHKSPLLLRCRYCERTVGREDMELR